LPSRPRFRKKLRATSAASFTLSGSFDGVCSSYSLQSQLPFWPLALRSQHLARCCWFTNGMGHLLPGWWVWGMERSSEVTASVRL
jgi:hypothetical protein